MLHWLCDFFELATLVYTTSNHARTSKWVAPSVSNFGEEVLGYLQEGLSGIDSECDCTV